MPLPHVEYRGASDSTLVNHAHQLSNSVANTHQSLVEIHQMCRAAEHIARQAKQAVLQSPRSSLGQQTSAQALKVAKDTLKDLANRLEGPIFDNKFNAQHHDDLMSGRKMGFVPLRDKVKYSEKQIRGTYEKIEKIACRYGPDASTAFQTVKNLPYSYSAELLGKNLQSSLNQLRNLS